jgi:hypothetical protein
MWELISKWWDIQSDRIIEQRNRLAAVAMQAPDDLELQQEVAAELDHMLDQYHVYLLPFMVEAGGAGGKGVKRGRAGG